MNQGRAPRDTTDWERRLDEGMAAHQANDLERAERLYRLVLKRQPRHALALNRLGILLHQTGRPREARAALDQAEQLAPKHTDFSISHAQVLLEQGHFTAARDRLQRLRTQRPDSDMVVECLAHALTGNGEIDAALAALEERLETHPRSFRLWLMAGDLHSRLGHREAAVKAWRNAAGGAGIIRETALLRIAYMQLQTARAQEAMETYREALACNADSVSAHCGLASAASQLGDFETLVREANAALRIDPKFYTAWDQLSLAPDGDFEATAKRMRAAVASAGGDPQAWLLHMALARTLDRAKRYDEAFAACCEAHRLQSLAGQEAGTRLDTFDQVRQHLTPTLLDRIPAHEADNLRPIFIVGMPRSGTTLVEAVLGEHPSVAAGGEMRVLESWLQRNSATPADPSLSRRLAEAGDEALAALAADWAHELKQAQGESDYITDKLPENFYYLGVIAKIFPRARFVHVRRDPRDTCLSCFMTALGGHDAGLAASIADVGVYYREYEKLMTYWEHSLGKERIVEVQYEELVENPEPGTRRLLEALQLEWHPGCLDYYRSERPMATASLGQVRRPMYTHSIGRWEAYAAHLEPLLAALRDDMQEAGRT
jgi:tetratricopeptide (TPR) repeat protein